MKLVTSRSNQTVDWNLDKNQNMRPEKWYFQFLRINYGVVFVTQIEWSIKVRRFAGDSKDEDWRRVTSWEAQNFINFSCTIADFLITWRTRWIVLQQVSSCCFSLPTIAILNFNFLPLSSSFTSIQVLATLAFCSMNGVFFHSPLCSIFFGCKTCLLTIKKP